MGDFTATRQYTYVPLTLIKSEENNTNENELYNKHNASMHQTTGHKHTGGVGDAPLLPQSVPVGGTIGFNDFNGALTFDSNYWKYCDGSNHDFGGAVGIQPLPDLSNRYLVGFGTEGGGDIGTAPWNAAPVGNASHQRNLQHAHTMTGHVHTINHGHANTIAATVPPHYHGKGTLASNTFSTNWPSATHTHIMSGIDGDHSHEFGMVDGTSGAGSYWPKNELKEAADRQYTIGGGVHGHTLSSTGAMDHNHQVTLLNADLTGSVGNVAGSNGDLNFACSMGGGVTDYAGNSGNTVDTMNNQLSATEDIQPRSIRIRFIMRVA